MAVVAFVKKSFLGLSEALFNYKSTDIIINLVKKMTRDPFYEIFRRMMRYFGDIEKEFKIPKKLIEDQPGFAIKRPGGVEKRSGFSISISSNGKNPPKVGVRRFGSGVGWEKLPQGKKEIAPTLQPLKKTLTEISEAVPKKLPQREIKERVIPEYNVLADVCRATITLTAEGVESKDNVRVKFYHESVEIFAVAPDLKREYFCTVALPTSTEKNGTTVEVDKKQVIIKIPRQLDLI